MSDLAFVTDGTLETIVDPVERQRERAEEMLRECSERCISRAFTYADAGLHYLGTLRRSNADISEQLEEYETTLKAFLVQVMALRGVEHVG